MKIKSISLLALALTLPFAMLVGCGSTPEEGASGASSLPDWVTQPRAEDGLAATACVATADSFGLDQSRADLGARQQLAAQLGIQIESMAEQYERTIETEDGINTGAHFEEVTRGIIDQELRGSHRIKGGYVRMPNGEREFCSMIAVGQSSVNVILERVANAAGADKEVFTQGEMREQFMSQEALNSLEEQLEKQQ